MTSRWHCKFSLMISWMLRLGCCGQTRSINGYRFSGFFCHFVITAIAVAMEDNWSLSFIMMTSSNGNIFCVTGPLCGEITGPGEIPTQRPVTRSFDVFFDPRLNKRLSKQPWGWWFETPSCSLWRHRNVWRRLSTTCLGTGSSGKHRCLSKANHK